MLKWLGTRLGAKYAQLWSCVTTQKRTFNFSTTMLPQTTTEKLADVKARRAEMDCKLEEAQHEADREEAERAHKEGEKVECEEEV